MYVYLHTHTVVCLKIPMPPCMFIYTHTVVCFNISMAPCIFIYTCSVVCSDIPVASCPIKYKEMYAQQTKQETCDVVGNRET